MSAGEALEWTLLPSPPVRNFAKAAAIKLIDAYQATLSPDHGPLRHLFPYGYCRHHPTCSHYGKLMIDKHGVIIGSAKTILRIVRCNPWSKPDEERIIRATNI